MQCPSYSSFEGLCAGVLHPATSGVDIRCPLQHSASQDSAPARHVFQILAERPLQHASVSAVRTRCCTALTRHARQIAGYHTADRPSCTLSACGRWVWTVQVAGREDKNLRIDNVRAASCLALQKNSKRRACLDVELPIGQLQRLAGLQRRLRDAACLQDQQRSPQVALRGLSPRERSVAARIMINFKHPPL